MLKNNYEGGHRPCRRTHSARTLTEALKIHCQSVCLHNMPGLTTTEQGLEQIVSWSARLSRHARQGPTPAVPYGSGKGSSCRSLAARRRVAMRPVSMARPSLGEGTPPAALAVGRGTLPRSARSTVQGGPRCASPSTASITRCSRCSASSNRALPQQGIAYGNIA